MAAARPQVALAAAFLIAPLIHVGVHLLLSVSGGHDPYPNAQFSISERVSAAVVQPIVGAPVVMGSFLWLICVPAAIAIAVGLIRQRERDAWLVVGVLTTGFLMSFLALARGDTPSRYFIPWIVAVAAVGIRWLCQAKSTLKIVVAIVILVTAVSGTRVAIADWVRKEQRGSAAVEMAGAVASAGCPLYLANFDLERRVAIPRLLKFAQTTPLADCDPGSLAAYAMTWSDSRLPLSLTHQCPTAWTRLQEQRGVRLYFCHSFSGERIPDQDATSGDPLQQVVRMVVPTGVPSPSTLFQPSRHAAGS
jgi:hypothetical protein